MINNIISRVILNNKWQEVNIGDNNNFYLIAIKDKKSKNDTVDPQTIKFITFEIGIDSGIKNQPLTIQYITLNFNDLTSNNNELNKITAFGRYNGLPSKFYIKITSLDDGLKKIEKGETSISININTMKI